MIMNVLWLEDGIDIGEGFDGTCPGLIINDTDTLAGGAFVNEV